MSDHRQGKGHPILVHHLSEPVQLKFLMLATIGLCVTYALSGFVIRKVPYFRDVL